MKFLFRLALPAFLIFTLSTCSDNGGGKLVLQANNEWIKGRNHGAIEIFKSVLKKYPSGEYAKESLFRLGEIYHFSLNNSAQAISYFQEVMELDKQGSFGFNAQTEEYTDLIKDGVIDPTKVVRTALQNAASVASLMLTTDAMIAEKPKKDGGSPAMPDMGGGMGGMGGGMGF